MVGLFRLSVQRIIVHTQGRPFLVWGTDDLLALFRCLSCELQLPLTGQGADKEVRDADRPVSGAGKLGSGSPSIIMLESMLCQAMQDLRTCRDNQHLLRI